MNLPARLVSGDNFRSGVVGRINGIIDYLRQSRLVGDNKTIVLNQTSGGITISCKAQGGGGAGGSSSFQHPFKLSIVHDENGNPQVSVHGGQFVIQGSEYYTPIFIAYEEMPEGSAFQAQPYLDIDWEEAEDKEYYIFAVCYDAMEEGEIYSDGCCLVAHPDNIFMPFCPGFFSIPIGSVQKTATSSSESENNNEQPKYSLKVNEQFIFSDIVIDDWGKNMPWGIRFLISWQVRDENHTGIAEQDTFNIDKVILNKGHVYLADDAYEIEDIGYTPQGSSGSGNNNSNSTNMQNGYYVAYINNEMIYWTDDIRSVELNNKCMILADFYVYNRQIYAYQYFNNDIHFDSEMAFPFKIYFDFNEEDEQVMKIYTGQVFENSDRFRLYNFTDQLIEIDLAELQQGNYGVVGVLKFDGEAIVPQIIVVDENITTNDIPNIEGYRVFTIASFTKTLPSSSSSSSESEEQPLPIYTVNYQYQLGNLIINDHYHDLPFTAMLQIDDGEASDVKTARSDWTLEDVVNVGGNIYCSLNEQVFPFNMTFASDDQAVPGSNGTAWCYIQRIWDGSDYDYEIHWTTTDPSSSLWETDSSTSELTNEKFIVSKVVWSTNVIVNNYHPSDLFLPQLDTFKVKVADDNDTLFAHRDYKAEYLSEKIMTNRAENYASSTWPTVGNDKMNGYIYKEAYDGQNGNGSYLFLRWDYPNITGYDNINYKTMNLISGGVIFEQQGKIRLNNNESAARYLPDIVSAVEPLYISSANQQLIFSANMSNYVSAITTSGSCISATVQSQTSTGKTVNINLDKPCLFEDFAISGTVPINVTGSGNNWNVGFNDSDFIKNVTGSNCINATKSGNTAVVSLDKTCVFQDFQINGNSPIQVTGSGNSWNVGINDSDYIKTVTGTNCINATKSGNAVTVSLNKSCVFQDLNITGTDPINVTGSGTTWNVGFNDSGFVKEVNGTNCISASKSGNAVTVSLDKACVFENLSIQGGNKISVTGSGQSWTVSYIDDSSSSSGGEGGTTVIPGDCLSGVVTSSGTVLNVDKTCVFEDFGIEGQNGIHVTNTGGQDNQDWIVQLNVSGAGILLFNNGTLSTLSIPSSPSVLVAGSGGLSWIPYSDCSNACNGGN